MQFLRKKNRLNAASTDCFVHPSLVWPKHNCMKWDIVTQCIIFKKKDWGAKRSLFVRPFVRIYVCLYVRNDRRINHVNMQNYLSLCIWIHHLSIKIIIFIIMNKVSCFHLKVRNYHVFSNKLFEVRPGLSVGWLVSPLFRWSVCHNFQKGRRVSHTMLLSEHFLYSTNL